MFPQEILSLISEFEDKYNVIESKHKINAVIKYGYCWWLKDSCSYSHLSDEYTAKKEIFVFQQHKVFITNRRQWEHFLKYFRLCENLYKINAMDIVTTELGARLPEGATFQAYGKFLLP